MSTENTGADVDQNADAASLTPAYTQTPNTVAIERYTQPSYGYGYGAPDDGKIHVMELLRVIRKWKWLIVSLVVVVTTIASIEIYRTPSTYRASAILEIGRDDLEALKTNNLIIQNEDPISVSMKTDTIKLTSPPLLQEVVEKLNLDQNPKFLAVNDRKSFWSALKSLVSGASGQEQEHAQPAVFTSTSSDRKPSDNRSPQQSERLAPYVSVLQNNLEVEPIKDSRMMKVSFVHTDPGVAADVANGIAQDFIDFSFQTKTARYTKASEWLDRSTRELKARVEQAEKGLADYTREHNIFSLEGKETLTTDKLSRLHDQETRAETDRILKQSLYEEAKGGKLVDIPEAFSDQKIAELSKTLSELETKQAEMRVTYGPKNPEMVEVTQQIDSIKQQIEEGRVTLVEKLRADYERAVRDEQALKGALTTAKGQAVQENQDAIQFNILKQEVETSKSLYTEFLQKTNQANLDVAEQNSNLRLISPAAAPKAPISPDRPLTIFVALSLSLTTGILLAFFLEYLDNSIKSVDDINRYIQLPALGIIPTFRSNSKRQGVTGKQRPALSKGTQSVALSRVDANNKSAAAEAYRAFRTSLLLSTAGSPPKTILVTSGRPGEGKTTTAINTAISLAQLGASVLLVDCDLRRPSVHKAFNINQGQGLTTYLFRNVEIDSLIQSVSIPNLYVLPSGAIPPNPAELISSDRMKDLMRTLSSRFDHIVIDSPPLINVTDPVIVSTMVDGVVLVVHGAKSTRYMVQRAKQELTSVGAKIFGVVLNNIDLKSEGYNDYYYYRYYSSYEQKA